MKNISMALLFLLVSIFGGLLISSLIGYLYQGNIFNLSDWFFQFLLWIVAFSVIYVVIRWYSFGAGLGTSLILALGQTYFLKNWQVYTPFNGYFSILLFSIPIFGLMPLLFRYIWFKIIYARSLLFTLASGLIYLLSAYLAHFAGSYANLNYPGFFFRGILLGIVLAVTISLTELILNRYLFRSTGESNENLAENSEDDDE